MSGGMKKVYIEKTEQALEYCLKMNCLGCPQNKGSYKDCKFFEQKKKAMEGGEDNA